MTKIRINALHLSLACCFLAIASLPAGATTEGTCFHVRNVQSNDVLNIREAQSAQSRIVATIPPTQHGIIALEGTCEPASAALDSRWCAIAYYDGDLTARGYVKRRFLEPSECP